MADRDPVVKVRTALQEAVELLNKNKGRVVKNHEMRKVVSCGDPGLWRDLAQDPEEGFTQYQFIWQSEHWWADAETVTALIETKKKARRVGEKSR